MTRKDGRAPDQLRKVTITEDYLKHPEGSCLITFGETKVICAATVEDSVPPFLKNTGAGWVTAEYGMLPRSCTTRIKRDRARTAGRTLEIQRLIGRSLRSVVDMEQLGERTVKVDCDVIQADGGTRTAAITGGFVAMVKALQTLQDQAADEGVPVKEFVAAVSVGALDEQLLLDLNYEEDFNADIDMNVVMVQSGDFVEIQGTAEGKPFSKQQADDLLALAAKGIQDLIVLQKQTLGDMVLKG
jgi:ribonuclease PH